MAANRREQVDADSLFSLRRSLKVKKGGIWRDHTAPVFPGYVFLKSDSLQVALVEELRSVPGFLRFLPSNDRIQPLAERDEALVRHFLSFGQVLRRSVVKFDENNRIRVVTGPLKGLEGQITKVDRRKSRARVRLALYQESFDIDFGFEALEPAAQPAAGQP